MESVDIINHWDADLYDEKHHFISQYGLKSVNALAAKEGEEILDIGCGTGDLTYSIRKTGATVLGIDSSQEMIERAKEKYPDIPFQVKDVLELSEEKKGMEKYDAVFSNAVLHWVKDAGLALSQIHAVLKPGGRFVAEFGAEGNVETILSTAKKVLAEYGHFPQSKKTTWFFPSVEKYRAMLSDKGFNTHMIRSVDRRTPLDDGKRGLANWMEMFCDFLFAGLTAEKKEEIFKEIESRLKESLFANGKWHADYVRLQLFATK